MVGICNICGDILLNLAIMWLVFTQDDVQLFETRKFEIFIRPRSRCNDDILNPYGDFILSISYDALGTLVLEIVIDIDGDSIELTWFP